MKTIFVGWDDVIAVDFTRSAESVAKRGADVMKILRDTEMKVCVQENCARSSQDEQFEQDGHSLQSS